jgi:sec-independent protein translocase protein TatB
MDGFFGIGIQELILIAIVALIVLGPERLPATLREIAKFIRSVRNLTNEFTAQFGDDFKALEDLDPRRILQREIESIDEEEKPAKGKATTAKPAPSTKPTPAKATTAKTTTTATAKSTTSTSTAKSATSTTKTVTATQPSSEPAPTMTAPSSSPSSASPITETTSVAAPVTESENRIAPPTVTPAPVEQDAAPVVTVAYTGSVNGVAPKEVESTTPSNGTPTANVTTNGAQAHPIPQSE